MKLFERFRRALSGSASFMLETVAPSDAFIKAIEEGGFEAFDSKAAKAKTGDLDEEALCLYSYKDPLVKKAVLEVKSKGNRKIAKILSKAAYVKLAQETSRRGAWPRFEKVALTFIPMTARDIRKRGWNQCAILAQGIKDEDAADDFELFPYALSKTRATEDQVGKSRRERLLNLKDCFKAHPSVKGRDVIVVDDIRTTGATLKEAARALKAAGAKSVLCLAIAC